MFDTFLSFPRVLNMLGFQCTRVVNMRICEYVKIHGILNVLISEYTKVLNVSGV